MATRGVDLGLAFGSAPVKVRAIDTEIADGSDSQHPDQAADIAVACTRKLRVCSLMLAALCISRATAEVGDELLGRGERPPIAGLGDERRQRDRAAHRELARAVPELAELTFDGLLEVFDPGVQR